MKQNITFCGFTDAFRDHGREDQFSYDALRLLFDYFERFDEDCGTETELDVIAICCDFNEDDWSEIAYSYNIDISEYDDDDTEEIVINYLQENTSYVGKTSRTLVYQSF